MHFKKLQVLVLRFCDFIYQEIITDIPPSITYGCNFKF